MTVFSAFISPLSDFFASQDLHRELPLSSYRAIFFGFISPGAKLPANPLNSIFVLILKQNTSSTSEHGASPGTW
jgi:hypothetical protein